MLSVESLSADQAATYYQKDSYYSAEKPGAWTRKASDALGLRGEIDDENWQRALAGRDPHTGEQRIQAGANGEHRPATDLTFSGPKSVSMAGLVLGREEVIEAHRQAVEATLEYIEQDGALARVTKDGITKKVKTGNLLVAIYEHSYSRELDPQLHTHCCVLNMTQMPDGSWKALSNERFFENKLFYGQIYRNELAANLKKLGYRIEYDKNGLFEIAGIDKSVREAFSRRSEQIKAALDDIRERYPYANESELREYATLGSRVAKQKNVDRNAVRLSWVERLGAFGMTLDDLHRNIDKEMKETGWDKETINAHEAIRTVGKDLDKREDKFSSEELLRTAARLTMGVARVRDLIMATRRLTQIGEFVQNEDGSYSTAAKKQLERETVQMTRDGQGKFAPLMTKDDALKALEGRGLTQSQTDLNVHALTSRDMIIGGHGPPGTGKTFGLATLRDILEAQGQTIRGVAFTGKAADTLEQEAGIKSNTIARDLYVSGRTHWIVVDEASMIGSTDMHDILKRAKEEGSRVLIIGDTDQLPSISAGRIFKDLIEHCMSTVEMKEIIRQKDGTYKDIVRSLVEKRIDEAFTKLTKAGKIHEIGDSTERIATIAKDYTDRSDWRNTIVLSSKNVDARELNTMIRSTLKESGEIGLQDHEITVRTPVSLSPTDQRFGQSYEPGQYVFVRKAGVGGLRAGDEARVVAVDTSKHTLMIETGKDAQRIVDLVREGGNLSVYEERQDRFSEREKIVFTKNDSRLKVRNGQMGNILKIDEKGQMIIAMQDGSTRHVDPATYRYVNHADAVTTYKAQGITQNNVIVNAPADGMQTYNAIYVQATRGKYDLQMYTDSTENLIERVKIEQDKTSTLEKPTGRGQRQMPDYQSGEQTREKDVDKEAVMTAKNAASKPQNQEIEHRDTQSKDMPVRDTTDQNEGRQSQEQEPDNIHQREMERER